jgi:hypothetical protein
MSTYSIVWETEGIEAENPIDAAQIAFDQIQEGYATSFTLLNEQTGEMHSVDLGEIEDEYLCRVTQYVSVFERNQNKTNT